MRSFSASNARVVGCWDKTHGPVGQTSDLRRSAQPGYTGAVARDGHYIAVVGAGACEPEVARVAEEVGRLVARAGAVLVCGGLGGVMEAACRGARAEGGTTVGVLPSESRRDANRHVEVAVATGMGEARNAIVARTADAIIAVGGEFGTLSEIALALKMGKPVVGIDTWELSRQGRRTEAIARAARPEEAVALALRLAARPGA